MNPKSNHPSPPGTAPNRCAIFRIWPGMPRCVLPAGHEGDHRWPANIGHVSATVHEPPPRYHGEALPLRSGKAKPATSCREAITTAIKTWGTAAVVSAIAPEKAERVTNPREAFSLVRNLTKLKRERLVGIYLDAQNKPIGAPVMLSVGTLNTSRTHPREILRPAIMKGALGFVLVHNHPSGNLTPSIDDVNFTHAMQKAAELMGMEIYDHLIVSREGFISLREKGVMA